MEEIESKVESASKTAPIDRLPEAETLADQVREAPREATLIPIERISMERIMQLEACTRCGECLNWCPVYDQDRREDIIPRTKVRDFYRIIKGQHGLIASILRKSRLAEPFKDFLRRVFFIPKITEDTVRDFVRNLYECSTCGQCQVVCPADIDTVNIWENIREAIVSSGYGPLPQQIPLVKSVKAYDNPWQQPRQARTKWIRRAKKEGLLKEVPREVKKSRPKVLLFLGCTAVYDVNVRQIAINTVNIFESLGVDYACLGDSERCCASVMLRMGDPEFERVARQNIDQFNSIGIETLVTSCAGCYKTIKEDYPKVKGLDFEVLHTVELLKRLMDKGILSFSHNVERMVTYHDPCHLGRAAGVFDAPRDILRAIPGLRLLEMERIYQYSRCCGAGGGVKAGFPDIQSRMAERRIKEAEATGAQELVSACPFCFAGLQVGIKAMGSPLVMSDVTSLVAKALLGSNAEEAAEGVKTE